MRSRYLVKTLVMLRRRGPDVFECLGPERAIVERAADALGRSGYSGTVAGERHAGDAVREAGVVRHTGDPERQGVRRA